ncbi:MAG TPA: hypothetical protein VMB74_11265 [Streptosporangiaceae bacterium]|nr:hypothetical protein [Streptosporangiaceae bacterium]
MTANPALAPLQFLPGRWDMELSDASFLPDPDAKLTGSVTFDWIEQGAALVMRMGEAPTPAATWIIGRDEAEHDFKVRYRRTDES